ncbi:Cytidine deaminase [Sporomusa silvacetica DSM 10669]|uniref:Cytidine deaminase n=1 Tax=Sporomusa silvacetica DSM 10669 TaxID=1123289 RepID=A0ABZ3IM65_9FIRM|nr:cytidine deaminase [Sporomusa silvacetica]OZC15947.1 cytidine deaminase [Sporomusa silvacetica DSM 10669]
MEELVKAAISAREEAYVPYSGFKVGAAVQGKSGRIYSGCNIENASYGLSNCAERTAIFKAVSEGEQELIAIAVVADTSGPVSPCGACRQVMAEFGIRQIILSNLNGKQRTVTIEELLPFSFAKGDVIS